MYNTMLSKSRKFWDKLSNVYKDIPIINQKVDDEMNIIKNIRK